MSYPQAPLCGGGRANRQKIWRAIYAFMILLGAMACLAAAQSSGGYSGDEPPAVAPEPTPDSPSAKPPSISGTIVDPDGAVIPGATVTLTQAASSQRCISAGDGSFQFPHASVGAYDISIAAPGFAALEKSGTLRDGESLVLPPVQLAVGTMIQVTNAETQEQVAEEQIHEQERQRLLGVVPNFYVTYEKHPMPLNPRQKFQLAWKSSVDPVQFGINAVIAGFQQSADAFPGYGQGMQGYAKRFGADTADTWIGTFIGGAILPSVLKQDPRYFYKGTGSKKSRFFYAVANAFICRGDNGRWQPNYSNMLGSLAAGGISNLYYPASNRQGAALTFENTAIGLGASAFSAVLQEFLLKRVTPHNPDTDPPPN